jgi:hypothetical protein
MNSDSGINYPGVEPKQRVNPFISAISLNFADCKHSIVNVVLLVSAFCGKMPAPSQLFNKPYSLP